jgi:hypothetical protein
MKTTPIKLLTIIIGSEYEHELRDLLPKLGARGFTYAVAHGQGAHEPREGFFDGSNIQFQVLATEEIAKRILEHLEKSYLPRVPLVAYAVSVDAIPAGHFG